MERALARLGDDTWNAFLHVRADEARAEARRLAREGPRARPLWGLVLSVKDNLAVEGAPMTCGSRHLARHVAPYTATSVARLQAAGAIVLGKTNLDEFGAGSSGENSAFGPTRNPLDPERVPGGSSSGAGASLAAGVADLALGSDTGGSARCPAAFCGLAALKPTNGLLSRHGLADLAMSLETPAPLARDVAGVARAMDALAPGHAFHACLADAAPEGLRVGVPREFLDGVADDVARPVRAALARLEAKGARVVETKLPALRHALAAYYVINYAELASAMSRYDGTRFGAPGPEGEPYADAAAKARASFGLEVKRRILLGTFATSREERGRWHESALRARAEVARDFERALARAEADVLMGPTMPVRAWRLGERVDDPRLAYAADVLTVGANLAGAPAGSVPLRVDGLPVGLQVIGARGADASVMRAMRAAEGAIA